MAVKHILVPLAGGHDETHALLVALTLAKKLSAHVTVTCDVMEPGIYMDAVGMGIPSFASNEVQKILDEARTERQRRARMSFDKAVAAAKLPIVDKPSASGASTYWLDDVEATPVVGISRLADLVVVGRPAKVGGYAERCMLEEAIFRARRPVLVVPHSCNQLGPAAAIAWNGSPEVAAAAQHVVNLLPSGSKVIVIQVGELAHGAIPLRALTDYLGWQRFEIEMHQVKDKPQATGQVILNAAKRAGADFLVMGAYSHSRLRELLLGGVTEHMLQHADMPLFVAH